MSNETTNDGEPERSIALETEDVAIVFRHDGHLELSFPELHDAYVPEHILAALAVSNAIMDDDFFEEIQRAFEGRMLETHAAPPPSRAPCRPELRIVR